MSTRRTCPPLSKTCSATTAPSVSRWNLSLDFFLEYVCTTVRVHVVTSIRVLLGVEILEFRCLTWNLEAIIVQESKRFCSVTVRRKLGRAKHTFDPYRYVQDDWDPGESMVARFGDIEREERTSARVAQQEDAKAEREEIERRKQRAARRQTFARRG